LPKQQGQGFAGRNIDFSSRLKYGYERSKNIPKAVIAHFSDSVAGLEPMRKQVTFLSESCE